MSGGRIRTAKGAIEVAVPPGAKEARACWCIAADGDDLDALLAIHRVPVRHRIRVRTTKLAERRFEEERRRTKVIPRLMDERAALKLVFATMIRAADRWCRVSITDLERHQLRLLRAELGLDPPPAADDAKPVHRKRAAA
jgi:hypothetical protein